MPTRLLVVSGPDRGLSVAVPSDGRLRIGRGREATVPLSDPYVSRIHCEVVSTGDVVAVIDLDSAGGTFLNGQRVKTEQLTPADVLMIGETALRLQDDVLADQVTLAPPSAEVIDAAASQQTPPPEPPLSPKAATNLKPKTEAKLVVLPGDRLAELTGTTLSHFEVGPLLGRGTSGMVFKARDINNNRTVALKVLWPECSRDDVLIQRFIRAMKTVLPVRHPNIVTLWGAGKKGPYCWMAMEYVEGESLTQVIQRIGIAGMMDWRNAFRIMAHLAKALEFAHGIQIIHRNLTPQNVMVRSADKVTKLGDLMLARAMDGELAEQLTRPGEILGDVRYMSPERASAGLAYCDERADLYSLGALVYAALTGKPPFEGDSLVGTLTRIARDTPEPPKKFQLSIPDRFSGAVMKLLAKKKEQRYQTATELLAELTSMAKFLGVTV